ncbi:MAG: hypothetical protein NC084_13455 [Bacteroides sp.]|nr:hypothetical protein [Roseburia sp.]MCM1463702.1 hypothetical protein [Bacteroides sp.]
MSGKITHYTQGSSYGCAATCVCMCMKVSPSEVHAKYPDLDLWAIANWRNFAGLYGYTTDPEVPGQLGGYQKIFELLKSGYPVIVKVAAGYSTSNDDHWVVVTKYKGSGTNFSANQFTCSDPAKSASETPLNEAERFKGVYKYIVVKK